AFAVAVAVVGLCRGLDAPLPDRTASGGHKRRRLELARNALLRRHLEAAAGLWRLHVRGTAGRDQFAWRTHADQQVASVDRRGAAVRDRIRADAAVTDIAGGSGRCA